MSGSLLSFQMTIDDTRILRRILSYTSSVLLICRGPYLTMSESMAVFLSIRRTLSLETINDTVTHSLGSSGDGGVTATAYLSAQDLS